MLDHYILPDTLHGVEFLVDLVPNQEHLPKSAFPQYFDDFKILVFVFLQSLFKQRGSSPLFISLIHLVDLIEVSLDFHFVINRMSLVLLLSEGKLVFEFCVVFAR
jgi:hypothetical protein